MHIDRQTLQELEIYTDGACSGNPGPGGWGAVLIYRGIEKEISGSALQTTNNRMELYAIIAALKELKRPCIVKLYSDSAYVVNAFQNGWIQNWQKLGWRKADGKAILNIDLWQELISLTREHQVQFIKVKGHADNLYNNRCDFLARNAIQKLTDKV